MKQPGGTLARHYGVGTKRHPRDLYTEPVNATLALLDRVSFSTPIWDPARGRGNILKACRKRGLLAFGTDIDEDKDFFSLYAETISGAAEAMICNPPYCHATRWLVRARELMGTRKIALFLRLQFLEGLRRGELFRGAHRPQHIFVFSGRVGLQREDGTCHDGGMMPYAWFIWEGEAKTTNVDWIAP